MPTSIARLRSHRSGGISDCFEYSCSRALRSASSIAVPVGPFGVMCVRRTIFEGKLAGLVPGWGATADALFGSSPRSADLCFRLADRLSPNRCVSSAGATCSMSEAPHCWPSLSQAILRTGCRRPVARLSIDFRLDPHQSDHDPRLPRHLFRPRPQRRRRHLRPRSDPGARGVARFHAVVAARSPSDWVRCSVPLTRDI